MDATNTKWESMYKHMFSKWQRAENMLKKMDLQQFHEQSQNATVCKEKCDALQEAVKELSELRQIDRKEKDFLIKEKNFQSQKLEEKCNLIRDQKLQLIEKEEAESQTVKNMKGTVSNMRARIGDLIESNEIKDNELQVLREQNEQLQQALEDRSDSVSGKTVKIIDGYDLFLSRYMDTFPQDAKDLSVQLIDKVTNRCSPAFKLLVRKCYEDFVCNLKGGILLIPDADSFVQTIFDLDIDLEAIMYLRVIQCLCPGLFDTLESTLVKQHDLTKHKILYRSKELTQARQVFALAFLSKYKWKHATAAAQMPKPVKKQSQPCPVGFDCLE